MGPARLSSSVSPARRRTSPSFSERAQANPHKRCASLSPATRSAPSRRSNPLPTVTTANNGPNRPGISPCAVTETKADAECSAGGDVVGEHVPKGSLGRARPTPLDTRMSENECPSQNAVRSDCLQARGEVFLDTSLRGNKCRGGSGKDVDRDGDEEGQGGAVAPGRGEVRLGGNKWESGGRVTPTAADAPSPACVPRREMAGLQRRGEGRMWEGTRDKVEAVKVDVVPRLESDARTCEAVATVATVTPGAGTEPAHEGARTSRRRIGLSLSLFLGLCVCVCVYIRICICVCVLCLYSVSVSVSCVLCLVSCVLCLVSCVLCLVSCFLFQSLSLSLSLSLRLRLRLRLSVSPCEKVCVGVWVQGSLSALKTEPRHGP
jgi:hypothetical protein